MRRRGGRRITRWVRVGLLVIGLIGLAAFTAWYALLREEPQVFSSPEEAFKYGSIGTEASGGVPYWVWIVLPEVFPEYLPTPGGGYESLGFIWEPGRDTPVGFSKKTIGIPRVGITCAVCHSGTYRTGAQQAPELVPTAPATRTDPLAYIRFLSAAASDTRFTADTLLPAIKARTTLNLFDEALYRYLIIPFTRDGLLALKDQYAWTNSRPPWGAGRIDPFNPVKFNQLRLDPAADATIGNSDMEPLWNMGQREGFALHWDGLNDSLTEVVLTGAIGDGATHQSLPVEDLKRLEAWLKGVQPPAYPYPINQALAARGEAVFRGRCASCHAFGGARTGSVIPLQEVGTDRHRVDMWTQEAADRYNAYAIGYPWRFSRFVKQEGYVAVAMDGIWLRAPYLHNGSVPTLEDLLEPASKRPTVFYRGYDVYDRERTGFVHQGPEAERFGFRYDTSVAGNSNQGHEGDAFGTTLPAEDKRALIEYLRTQ